MLSKKQRKEKLYTIKDWEEATDLERLYLHLMQPDDFELSYDEEDRLDSLRIVWGIMASKMNNKIRVDKIIEHVDVTKRQAYRMIEDASWLFGDVLKTNQEVDLLILKNRYFALAEKAEKAGLYDEARKCYDSGRDVMGKLEKMNPDPKTQIAGVIFSNNVNLLNSKAEDAQFEEVPDGVLELQAIGVHAGQTED